MHHRAGRALEGVEGSADDMVAALGEHLHRHVVRDEVLFDERAQKFVLRFAGGGEPDLDLLEAQLDEKTEKIQLFLQAHGYDKALVAVAQIYAAPDGRFFNVVFFAQRISHRGAGKYPGLYLSACIMVPFSFSCSVLGDGHGNEKSSVSWPFGPRDGALKISFAVPLLLPGNTRPLRAISLQNRRTA